MVKKNQEVELKLRIESRKEIIEKIEKLGATFISEATQTDYAYNSPVIDFGKTGEAFRLRHEVFGNGKKAYLTYKGSAAFSDEGHKIREEYEVEVSDFLKIKKILEALKFFLVLKVEKVRKTYHLDNVVIAVDALPFGDFVELEGDPVRSQMLRQKLGLADVMPIKKAYYDLQKEWERTERQ